MHKHMAITQTTQKNSCTLVSGPPAQTLKIMKNGGSTFKNCSLHENISTKYPDTLTATLELSIISDLQLCNEWPLRRHHKCTANNLELRLTFDRI